MQTHTLTSIESALPDGTVGSERAPPLRWQTLPWLGGGLLALWGGQRWIRYTTLDTEPRLLGAALVMLVGLGALGVWAAYNRTHEGTDKREHTETLGFAHWVGGLLVVLAIILALVAALAEIDTQAAAWLRLSALGCCLGAGGAWPRIWSWRHNRQGLRTLGIGLGLTGVTLIVRLLFTMPVVPDAEALSQLPTVLGDMYRGLGLSRAVLVPFVLSCLWPAAIWWACSQVARPPWALGAAILVILSPLQIWQPLSATPWILAPFVLLLVVVAGTQVMTTTRPGSWFWLGLGLALLWVEASAMRMLILIGVFVMALPLGFHLWSRTPRPGWLQCLYTGLGLVAGLLLYPAAELGEIAGLLQNYETSDNALSPLRLLAFWFQPETLELPYYLTYFLFAEGLLVLLGLVVVLVRGLRMPVPAVGGVAWIVGLVYASQHPDLFLSLSHLTAVVPWLLTTVALAALWPPLSQAMAAAWGWRLTERGLAIGVTCLFLWQLPGGVLGFNPLLVFTAQILDQDVVEVPGVIQDWTDTEIFVDSTTPMWFASPVWYTAGTCDQDTPVMSRPMGVAIDPVSPHVYVVGQEPGMLVALDWEHGQIRRRWEGDLQDPVEVAVMPDGSLRILDAGFNRVWRMDPDTEDFVLLTEENIFRPRGFHVLPDGQILVAATGSSRVVRYSAEGEWLEDVGDWSEVADLEQPTDVLAIGNHLWVIFPQQTILQDVYSGVQRKVTTHSITQAGPHMAALADGTFLLTDSEAGTILHMQESGDLNAVVKAGGEEWRRPVDIDVVETPEGIWMAVTDPELCRVSLWWLDPAMAVQRAGESTVP